MAKEWGWRLAEVMTDDPAALRRIKDCVSQIPALAKTYAWASVFADVECVLSETLYLAAYDYDGRGDFPGWWRRKARGRLSMLRSRHFKKLKKNLENRVNMHTTSTEGVPLDGEFY